MIRVSNQVEKNIVAVGPLLVAVPANAATDALPDIVKDGILNSEYVGRYIQNTGANACYYAFGINCQVLAYHGILAANQQLDCSNHGQRVSVLCTGAGGTTIAQTILKRVDFSDRANIHQGNQ